MIKSLHYFLFPKSTLLQISITKKFTLLCWPLNGMLRHSFGRELWILAITLYGSNVIILSPALAIKHACLPSRRRREAIRVCFSQEGRIRSPSLPSLHILSKFANDNQNLPHCPLFFSLSLSLFSHGEKHIIENYWIAFEIRQNNIWGWQSCVFLPVRNVQEFPILTQ